MVYGDATAPARPKNVKDHTRVCSCGGPTYAARTLATGIFDHRPDRRSVGSLLAQLHSRSSLPPSRGLGLEAAWFAHATHTGGLAKSRTEKGEISPETVGRWYLSSPRGGSATASSWPRTPVTALFGWWVGFSEGTTEGYPTSRPRWILRFVLKVTACPVPDGWYLANSRSVDTLPQILGSTFDVLYAELL